MRILVKLSTTLRDCVPGYDAEAGLSLDMPEGASVLELARHIKVPPEEIKIVMINGRQSQAADTLRDGDRVALFPAVGGG
ncbi:MoaD/ThiS family protein [uncultured Desulfovibrio sp.]|uniref:MoaD/ThiS family protein n=1 Tax=uncultured Desulfovibrio sp. TaxID=167968 RepID=UPI00262B848F|nr:MoaD/ThiS family protein [uncultured Desulfovibrio sp.]